jgi:hypothetical protein
MALGAAKHGVAIWAMTTSKSTLNTQLDTISFETSHLFFIFWVLSPFNIPRNIQHVFDNSQRVSNFSDFDDNGFNGFLSMASFYTSLNSWNLFRNNYSIFVMSIRDNGKRLI